MQSAYRVTGLQDGDSVKLPYGVKKARFRVNSGYIEMQFGPSFANVVPISSAAISVCIPFEFPIIDGKSPNTFKVTSAQEGRVDVFIDEIGGEPDPDYFNRP